MTLKKTKIESAPPRSTKHEEKNTNEGNFSNVKATNRTIDESLFQTPSLLHLTIGALSLMG